MMKTCIIDCTNCIYELVSYEFFWGVQRFSRVMFTPENWHISTILGWMKTHCPTMCQVIISKVPGKISTLVGSFLAKTALSPSLICARFSGGSSNRAKRFWWNVFPWRRGIWKGWYRDECCSQSCSDAEVITNTFSRYWGYNQTTIILIQNISKPWVRTLSQKDKTLLFVL